MSTLMVVFTGEYDVACKDVLRREFRRIESEPNVVFDFSDAKYLDSSCIGELLTLRRERRRRGFARETVVMPPGESLVKRVFDLCGLERVFNVTRSYRPRAGEVVVLQYISA
ncbi:MAG TPA: STAS domain-containing protein [Candidatus Baltobacteraceae bacterium]|jgi:anti-anti-sigma factor|nr:STAS domain-containing protein [Candidatus Baltobacteraceae bacterium]